MSLIITITSGTTPVPPEYTLMSVDIVKEVQRIPYAQLIYIDQNVVGQGFTISNSDYFALGTEVEIKSRYENQGSQDVTLFKGIVVGHNIDVNLSGALLTIELKDAAINATLVRQSMIYRDETDTAIIKTLITENGLTAGPLAATKVTHPELVQYVATDWDFMLARAQANALLLIADDGTISLAEVSLSASPKHTFDDISVVSAIEIEADGSHQYGDVATVSWDIATQKLTAPAKGIDFSLTQGNFKGADVATARGVKPLTLTNPVTLDPQESQAWADATLMRSRMSMLRGRISTLATMEGIADLKLLDVLEIDKIGKRFNGKTITTALRHQINSDGWQTDIQFGLPAKPFTDKREVTDTPAAGLLPAVNGLQIGIVDAFAEDPELRVKVILPSIDEKPDGAVWARLALPDAGLNRGHLFRPEPQDEVVVGFLNDDPRQAIILGALHSSKNAPPDDLKPTADNLMRVMVSKNGARIGFIDKDKPSVFLGTPEINTIFMDDEEQAIHIADQHGNTITMNKDGITIVSTKDLILEASGNVEIKGAKVDEINY